MNWSLLTIIFVVEAHFSASIDVDGVSGNKDDGAVDAGRRLASADADAADDPSQMFRILRGSYVRFGRDDEDKRSSSQLDREQQKRSKHYVRFGRSPVDVDEYFYDEDDDNNNADGVAQSWDFISRRSPRRHYVRFGRDSSNGRHYIRFGRNSGEDAAAAAKRASRHYVRFGRDEAHQQNSDDEKRVHYVRFGRGGELGIHETDSDRLNTADKRPNYVRFG